jgi:APA family basic amino acid/polyamine antiporter
MRRAQVNSGEVLCLSENVGRVHRIVVRLAEGATTVGSTEGYISIPIATAVGLGAIIGAGIFTLSGAAIALAGTWSLIAFVLVGLVAVTVAFQIGELGSLFPNADGASYSYVYEAFGSELGFVTGILLYFSFASAISVVALGFASYLASMLGLTIDVRVLAVALIAGLSAVNLLGIRKAAKVDFGLVVVKIVVLLLVVGFAAILAWKGVSHLVSLSAPFNGPQAIFDASVAIFFAYSGFQTISTFTPDVKGGARAAAKAVLASVSISMVIYVLVAVALLVLVPPTEYSITADPLASALVTSGAPSYLILIVDMGALIATASASLALILSSSRIMYQISKDGLLPRFARAYNERRDVARNGVLISTGIAIVMLYFGNVYVIAAMSNFGLLFSYLMASFALIHFRRRKLGGAFSSPYYPYLSAVSIAGILAFMFGMPKQVLVVGVILLLVLIMLYYSLVEYEERKTFKIRLFN